MNRAQAEVLAEIEWEYTEGQSFGVGEDNVLIWLLEHRWTITAPKGFLPTPFDSFPPQ